MIAAIEYFLPVWAQVTLGVAAFLLAVGVIWKRLVKPAANLITLLDNILPLLRQLSETFKGTPHAFVVLNEIVKEFRTDSGSSLRDVVNALHDAAKANQSAAQVLSVNAEAARLLSEQDRRQIALLVVLLDKLTARQKGNIATVDRIEAGAAADAAV